MSHSKLKMKVNKFILSTGQSPLGLVVRTGSIVRPENRGECLSAADRLPGTLVLAWFPNFVRLAAGLMRHERLSPDSRETLRKRTLLE
jgi:hypothetical protein